VVRLINRIPPVSTLPYRHLDYQIEEGRFIIEQEHPLQIIGQHNIENLTAAVTLCEALGLEREAVLTAAESFRGASRRLEPLLFTSRGNAYLDFAHAPSKVTASVRAVDSLYPDQPLLTVLELHTFSSLNKDFLPQYRNSLDRADHAIVMFDSQIMANKNMPPLENDVIYNAFGRSDMDIVRNRVELEKVLARVIKEENKQKMNVLLMSSGSFGGADIKKKLEELWDL